MPATLTTGGAIASANPDSAMADNAIGRRLSYKAKSWSTHQYSLAIAAARDRHFENDSRISRAGRDEGRCPCLMDGQGWRAFERTASDTQQAGQ